MLKTYTLKELEDTGLIQLGRGKVISRKDLKSIKGDYPVYSSSQLGLGKFGKYGEYMFDEELITWSVDGGGKLFYRKKHKFSITNVTGFLRILKKDMIDYKYLFYCLSILHSQINFDWVKKAHPSTLRKEYNNIPLPNIDKQKNIAARFDTIFYKIDEIKKLEKIKVEKNNSLIQKYLEKIFTTNKNLFKLSDCCEIKPLKNEVNNLDENIEVSFFPMKDLSINNKLAIPNQKRKLKDVKGSYTYFAEGDVLLAKITPCFENGKIGIASNLLNGIGFGSSEYIVFRPNKKLKNGWLYYFLNRSSFRFEGAQNMSGAVGHKRVNKIFIENKLIPIPSIVEQEKILSALENLSTFSKEINKIVIKKEKEMNSLKNSILNDLLNKNEAA